MLHPVRGAGLLLLITILLSGCNAVPRDAGDPPLPDLAESAWPDAIRLSNGTVNLVVVPSIGGRIMRYGYVGGPNVLWTNPDARREIATDTTQPTALAKYPNYGGDKAWPWPQDDWMLRLGRTWPPPPEVDAMPMKSRLRGALGVRLESRPIASHGARLVREIALGPSGSRVHILTRLELATSERPPEEIAAWSVTQVPGDAKLYARLTHESATVEPMEPVKRWGTTRPVSARTLALGSPAPRAGKVGLDADVLAAAAADTLFVQHSRTAASGSGGFHRAERAQVFSQAAKTSASPMPLYAELEFTSPRIDLAGRDPAELRVTWELFRSQAQKWDDQAVAKLLDNVGIAPSPADGTPEPANMRRPSGVP